MTQREREKDREGMCVEKDIDCVRAEGVGADVTQNQRETINLN